MITFFWLPLLPVFLLWGLPDVKELPDAAEARRTDISAGGMLRDQIPWTKLPEQQGIISLMDFDDTRPALLADINSIDLPRFVETVEGFSGWSLL